MMLVGAFDKTPNFPPHDKQIDEDDHDRLQDHAAKNDMLLVGFPIEDPLKTDRQDGADQGGDDAFEDDLMLIFHIFDTRM